MSTTPDPSARSSQATLLLERLADGDDGVGDELLGLLYDELHDLAERMMLGERKGHTLQPTALVHEAWMRIDPGQQGPVACRAHFLRLASRAMRRVLVDHARRRQALKRGEGVTVALVEENELGGGATDLHRVLDVEEALQKLAEKDGELAQIVELRFFGGLSAAEVGQALGKTRRQIEGSWAFARGWLRRELERGGQDG